MRAHASAARAGERAFGYLDEPRRQALRDTLRTMMLAMDLFLYDPPGRDRLTSNR